MNVPRWSQVLTNASPDAQTTCGRCPRRQLQHSSGHRFQCKGEGMQCTTRISALMSCQLICLGVRGCLPSSVMMVW